MNCDSLLNLFNFVTHPFCRPDSLLVLLIREFVKSLKVGQINLPFPQSVDFFRFSLNITKSHCR